MTENNPKPKIMVQNISCVLPEQHNLGGLFLGNVYGAQNATILKEYGIRAVLTSSIETNISYEFLDIPFHMKIQAHDKENYNLKEHINKCIDFIQKSRQLTNVYVHCFAGVSRSVAIVCAYIMWKLKWNYETTIAFVKAKRIVAKPNQGFVQQLIQIEQILMQSSHIQSQKHSKIQLPDSNQTIQTYNIATPQSQYLYKPKSSVSTVQTQEKQIKKQFQFQERNTTYLNNNHHSDHYSTSSNNLTQQNYNNLYKNNHNSYKSPRHSDLLKETTPPVQNYYHPNQSKKVYLQTDKKQKNDRFMYLQNFFPQNHSTTKEPQVTKPQSIVNPSSSAQNWMNNQKVGTSRQSIKKLQNTQSSSIKYQSNYQAQKPSNSHSYLILGGKKQTYNHNSIPVPKVVDRKQQSKNYQSSNNITNGQIYQTKELYDALDQRNPMNRTNLGLDFGIVSPRAKQYMLNDLPKAKNPINHHNSGYKSPISNNIYNSRFEFRSSAPSEGFFTNTNSVQKRESQKESSRCLIRPKDLPGYKNY